MGGNHNVAMAVLAEQSNRYMRNQEQTQTRKMGFFSMFASPKMASPKELEENMAATGRFLGFIATLALCAASFITMKTYHAHLEKQDELVTLLNNPNARVAAGKKGKQLSKKIAIKSELTKIDEETPVEDKISDLLAKAKVAKAKKIIEEAQSERLLNGYEAPKLLAAAHPAPQSVHYQLIEPAQQQQFVQPLPKVQVQPAQPMNGYWYPQNFEVQAPLPALQTVPTLVSKVAIQQPEPMREPLPKQSPSLADMPKKELIKALLLQLAKDGDLESQQ